MKKICIFLFLFFIIFAIGLIFELVDMIELYDEIAKMEAELNEYQDLPEYLVILRPTLFDSVSMFFMVIFSFCFAFFFYNLPLKIEGVEDEQSALRQKVKRIENDIEYFDSIINKKNP